MYDIRNGCNTKEGRSESEPSARVEFTLVNSSCQFPVLVPSLVSSSLNLLVSEAEISLFAIAILPGISR